MFIVIWMNNAWLCDIVDIVLLQMLRYMAEWKNKTTNFIVDFDIGRVLNTWINYGKMLS